MAGGVMVSSNHKDLPGKITVYVFYACIIAASGGAIFGYDNGISGGVTAMDSFLKKFFPSVYHKKKDNAHSTNQYCKFDSQILQLFTSSLYLAALASSIVASTMTRKFGRRLSMQLGGAIFFCGAAINGGAINVAMLIIGRILLGFGVGLINQSVPLYVSEMAPTRYRGFLNQFFQLMITIGILSANLVNYGTAKIEGGWGWRLGLALAAVPGAIIALGSSTLPDTPNSLIERHPNDPEEVKKMLKRIRGIDNVEEEYNDLVAASNASKLVEHPWRNLGLRKYRPQLVMAILIPFFQQVTGINVVMFYAPVLFETIGFGSNAALMSSVITGVVNVLATFIAIFTVDKIGRRALFLEGGTQMSICQAGLGILIGLKFGISGVAEISKGYANWVVVFICLFVSGFAWSWGPLGWLVPSEIFPLEIRSACQSINVSVNMIFTFLIAQALLTMLCHMKFGLFFFFAGWVVIMTIFIFFFLPETKGIPIEEMVVVWREHWFWKKFISDEDIPSVLELGKAGNV